MWLWRWKGDCGVGLLGEKTLQPECGAMHAESSEGAECSKDGTCQWRPPTGSGHGMVSNTIHFWFSFYALSGLLLGLLPDAQRADKIRLCAS